MSSAPFTTTALNAALNFGGQGLPIVNQTDATTSVCPDAGCTDAVTTDYINFLSFPDEAGAESFAADAPSTTRQRGTLVIQYTDLTTDNQRLLFEQALQDLF